MDIGDIRKHLNDLPGYIQQEIIGQDVIGQFGKRSKSQAPFYENPGLDDLCLVRFPDDADDEVIRVYRDDVPMARRRNILDNVLMVYYSLLESGSIETYFLCEELERLLGILDHTQLIAEKKSYGTLIIAEGEVVIWTPTPEQASKFQATHYSPWNTCPNCELDYNDLKLIEQDPKNDYGYYFGIRREEYTYVQRPDVVFFKMDDPAYNGLVRPQPHIRKSVLDHDIKTGERILFLDFLEDFGAGSFKALRPVSVVR